MREFFAFKLQDRRNMFSLLLNARRLLQQFIVDGYTMIESERLHYIRKQQKVLRCEIYDTPCNVQEQGEWDVSNIGQHVILPSSFTGGARYMMQNYLHAMSLCKWYGYLDLFLTMTCNPKWPEVRRFVKDTCLNTEDRPNILCRLFKIKLDALIRELKENEFFGKIQVGVKLDNRNVVPYNKHLLKRYQAHINVEWCNQASSIKYLFKYINKGPDKATVAIVENSDDEVTINVVNEIKQYYDCRYLSVCEASWRIFGYDVHYRTPSVLRLLFHLLGQQ
ncbi:uncharacterized protein LOC112504568 [Cynara cardunculus var. scolymus]|uniref:uncharacterized protein LOC112504568 n=1 Tax=Cynara cardunculus var. scolymus TaxID=59895 RepID=UPI000D62CDA9|nr:uncharacterized protein LOC112504568 [Cynara cardunculus var. scolymus]